MARGHGQRHLEKFSHPHSTLVRKEVVRAARDNVAVGVAFYAVVVGAVLALAAVVVGGTPIAFAALRMALTEGRRDVPLLFCVPPLSLVAFVGYALVLVGVVYPAPGSPAVHDPVNVALFLWSWLSCSRRSRAPGRSRPP